MFVVGVDGCRSGWIAVALDSGRFAGASYFDTFAELIDACADAAVIGVDIPIGLVSDGDRACDDLTRQFVGPRHRSVFGAPDRDEVIRDAESPDDSELSDADRRQRKSAQALRAKILEVDVLIRNHTPPPLALAAVARAAVARGRVEPESSDPPPASSGRRKHGRHAVFRGTDDRASLRRFARIINPSNQPKRPADGPIAYPGGRIIEVHPEASFCELVGKPLEHSKKSWNGMMQRMRALEAAGISVPTELGEIGGVAVDDVLDAAAVAWTANRYAEHRARSLPPRELWQHDGHRVIAIWI